MYKVAILPIGRKLSGRRKRQLSEALSPYAKLRWLPAQPLPTQAYHPTYKRYRAEKLCHFLAKQKPSNIARIVGLVSVDISTSLPGYLDHAVFGLSDVNGPAAVVSTFRLKQLGLSLSKTDRAWRSIVLHEWGHLLELPHCTTLDCAMRDAHRYVHRLSFVRPQFCAQCQQRLAKKRKHLDSRPQTR